MDLNILSELFPDFEPELIEALKQHGELKSFSEDDLLMKTNQNIRSTVLVLEGLLKVYREDDEGGEYFMYYLNPGNACALSLVCASKQETSSVMVRAASDTTVLALPVKLLDEWMHVYKSWYYFVLATYRSRFEELLSTIDQVAFRNLDERIIFYLRRHQQVLGSNIVSIPFTKIAAELNSSREVISRLMKKLSEKGYIRMHKSHFEILDLNIGLK
jgi:CRP/FNR family transcriptional regulator, anaerobic regulatory protein